jgi:hypothetical protein
MTTIEELEEQLSELKRDFIHHRHVGWQDCLTSTPRYQYRCPHCDSLKKPIEEKRDVCKCPDCGYQYTYGDCMRWFMGLPYGMPRNDKYAGVDLDGKNI